MRFARSNVQGPSLGSPAAMSEVPMPQWLIRFIRGWDTCVSGGIPLVSEPQNQSVWLTIRRHRSCCVHGEMDVAARWQHTPIYRAQMQPTWGERFSPSNIPRSPKPDAVHRGDKMCGPLEWFLYTSKPENLTHSLHSARSSVTG